MVVCVSDQPGTPVWCNVKGVGCEVWRTSKISSGLYPSCAATRSCEIMTGYEHRCAQVIMREREIFIDNLLVRVHLIIEMSRPTLRHGSLNSLFQVALFVWSRGARLPQRDPRNENGGCRFNWFIFEIVPARIQAQTVVAGEGLADLMWEARCGPREMSSMRTPAADDAAQFDRARLGPLRHY